MIIVPEHPFRRFGQMNDQSEERSISSVGLDRQHRLFALAQPAVQRSTAQRQRITHKAAIPDSAKHASNLPSQDNEARGKAAACFARAGGEQVV